MQSKYKHKTGTTTAVRRYYPLHHLWTVLRTCVGLAVVVGPGVSVANPFERHEIKGTVKIKGLDGIFRPEQGSRVYIEFPSDGIDQYSRTFVMPDDWGNYSIQLSTPLPQSSTLNGYCLLVCFTGLTPMDKYGSVVKHEDQFFNAGNIGGFAKIKIDRDTIIQDFMLDPSTTLPAPDRINAFIESSLVSKNPALYTDSWPKNVYPGGWRAISVTDIPHFIPHLYLPLVFILKILPNPNSARMNIGTLEFGPGAILDLSAPALTPRNPVKNGANVDSQPGYGEPGGNGGNGDPGIPGMPGTSLEMHVATLVTKGSLWIRTDGQPGSRGGDGGNGGTGGGSKLSYPPLVHYDGGPGGNGGNGGPGGAGGNTSKVTIDITDPELRYVRGDLREYPVGENFYYGNASEYPIRENFGSDPPADFHVDDGSIFVFGAPGRGSPGGKPGNPGHGGDEGRTRSIFGLQDTHGGQPGNPGQPGADGSNGTLPN
jgi:hypothetical protein